jgi:hypothetical protein
VLPSVVDGAAPSSSVAVRLMDQKYDDRGAETRATCHCFFVLWRNRPGGDGDKQSSLFEASSSAIQSVTLSSLGIAHGQLLYWTMATPSLTTTIAENSNNTISTNGDVAELPRHKYQFGNYLVAIHHRPSGQFSESRTPFHYTFTV